MNADILDAEFDDRVWPHAGLNRLAFRDADIGPAFDEARSRQARIAQQVGVGGSRLGQGLADRQSRDGQAEQTNPNNT